MKFPDAELLLIDFLKPFVAPVRVVSKVPGTRPDSFVRVWRTGGAAVNRVLDQPLLTVQAWGTDAWELAGKCRDAIHHHGSEITLLRGLEEVTGPYFDPDPASNVDRVTFTIQAQIRATRT